MNNELVSLNVMHVVMDTYQNILRNSSCTARFKVNGGLAALIQPNVQ